jgi:hypothetical protein
VLKLKKVYPLALCEIKAFSVEKRFSKDEMSKNKDEKAPEDKG